MSWLDTSVSTESLGPAGVRFIDHHCHPWLRGWQAQDAPDFRACFSESPARTLTDEHVPRSLPYRRALRELASLLGCEATEEAVLGVRRTATAEDYLARLFAGAGIGSLLLDDGFPPPGTALTVAEVGAASGLPVGRILRIETLLQDLTLDCARFGEVVERFDGLAGNLRASGIVALKSIAAYRSGLRLAPVDYAAAEEAWQRLRADAQRDGAVRLAAKPLVDFFAWRAVAHASRQGAAIQFHTGYGDPDLDLREANPLHLRPLLEEEALGGAKVVLLHGAYPYTREAAYLAAVYPQVYLDVSTALPPLGWAEIEAALTQALAVAPVSKVLLSTDGARIPEHHVLGARAARRALATVLRRAADSGELTADEAVEFAAWPLQRTAQSIYPVAATQQLG